MLISYPRALRSKKCYKESELEDTYRLCEYKFGANKIRSMRSKIGINEEVLLVERGVARKGSICLK